jgi:hypothetical protein
MQRITIEVKDSYTENVLEMLHSIKGIMIEKIRYDDTSFQKEGIDLDFIKLQTDPMARTWENEEDEAWNEL